MAASLIPLQHGKDVGKKSGIEFSGDMDQDTIAFEGDGGRSREGEFKETSSSRPCQASAPIKEAMIVLRVLPAPRGDFHAAVLPGCDLNRPLLSGCCLHEASSLLIPTEEASLTIV